MPNPKNGKAGSPVSPAAPTQALEADKTTAGALEKISAQQKRSASGAFGTTPLEPHKRPSPDDEGEQKKDWIEIVMTDEKKNPRTGVKYRVLMADGETAAEGTLDEKGFARVEHIEPGTCKICFPDLDQDAWEKL